MSDDKPVKYGIKAVEFANGKPCPHAGQWLHSFDFNAFDGRGFGKFTSRPLHALSFADRSEALKFWATTSTARRLRVDGKPNRPLTALTIVIEPLPEPEPAEK